MIESIIVTMFVEGEEYGLNFSGLRFLRLHLVTAPYAHTHTYIFFFNLSFHMQPQPVYPSKDIANAHCRLDARLQYPASTTDTVTPLKRAKVRGV